MSLHHEMCPRRTGGLNCMCAEYESRPAPTTLEKLPIEVAENISRIWGQSQVVVVTFDKTRGTTHVVTFGKSLEESVQAAEGGNRVKKALGWPEELCNAIPKRYADAIEAARLCFQQFVDGGSPVVADFARRSLIAIAEALGEKPGGQS